jgi:DNA-binding transcriptional MerR regulator
LTLESVPGCILSWVARRTYFRSGELARLAGVSTDTLRHYERMKVLPPPRRSTGNYRLYPPETADRLRLIRRALAVGFSLPELARILKVRDEGGAPCRQVKRLLEEKLSRLNERIEDFLSMREHLQAVLADWEARLAETPQGKPARLLESLDVPGGRQHLRYLKGNGR